MDEIKRRRTFAIISHPDAGKTTLTEKLLLYGGALHLAGTVTARKNQRATASDWMELEKKRGISISSTVLQFDYAGYRLNLLDTPGYLDFVGEVKSGLRVSEGTVLLVGATSGVEVGTEQTWQYCEETNMPRLIFVSKMDRENADFTKVVNDLQTKFGSKCVALQMPIGSYTSFKGIVDLLRMKAFIGTDAKESEIPADAKAQADSFRAKLVEAIASADDKLIEKYIADEPISQEELETALNSSILNIKLVINLGCIKFKFKQKSL